MTQPVLYLCGPINGCSDAEANDWRSMVKGLWVGRCIDPMARDYRGREAEAFREIVELDKLDIDEADILLVNYDRPSVGTSMEVLYAWEHGKTVLVVCREDSVISPWLRYHAHHIVHDFASAILKAASPSTCGIAPSGDKPILPIRVTTPETGLREALDADLSEIICAILEDEGGSGAPWSVIANRCAAQIVDEFPAAVPFQRKALEIIASDQQYRSGYCQTDIAVSPLLTAEEAQFIAREALSKGEGA